MFVINNRDDVCCSYCIYNDWFDTLSSSLLSCLSGKTLDDVKYLGLYEFALPKDTTHPKSDKREPVLLTSSFQPLRFIVSPKSIGGRQPCKIGSWPSVSKLMNCSFPRRNLCKPKSVSGLDITSTSVTLPVFPADFRARVSHTTLQSIWRDDDEYCRPRNDPNETGTRENVDDVDLATLLEKVLYGGRLELMVM